MLYVDAKEASKNPDLLERLVSEVQVEVTPLPCDYYILASPPHRPLMVERKTVNDLVASLRNKRIFDQIRLMEENRDADYCILVEGSLYQVDKWRGWSKGPLMRLIDSLALAWRVPLIPSYNKEWTAEWLIAKSRELESDKAPREISLRVKPKEMSAEEYAQFLVEGLPGVGPSLAKKLLGHFETARGVFNATLEQLLEVEGIGKKRAERIVEILSFKRTQVNPEGEEQKS